MRLLVLSIVSCLALAGASSRASAQEVLEEPATPYDRGRYTFGVSVGGYSSFGHTYFALGARFGYFVLPGLEVAAGGLKLFGGDPSIAMVSPEVRYVVPLRSSIRPFVGSFYRHWFIGVPYDDYDTLGGTIGVMWQRGSNLILGLGVTHERVVSSCDQDQGDDCSFTYPALILGLSI